MDICIRASGNFTYPTSHARRAKHSNPSAPTASTPSRLHSDPRRLEAHPLQQQNDIAARRSPGCPRSIDAAHPALLVWSRKDCRTQANALHLQHPSHSGFDVVPACAGRNGDARVHVSTLPLSASSSSSYGREPEREHGAPTPQGHRLIPMLLPSVYRIGSSSVSTRELIPGVLVPTTPSTPEPPSRSRAEFS